MALCILDSIRCLETIQMQSIIQEIQNLTTELQEDNRNLLKIIENLTRTPHSSSTHFDIQNSPCTIQPRKNSAKKTQKEPDATNISRISSQTIKQSSQRCKSIQSIKQSRITQKSLSLKRSRLERENILKGRQINFQSKMSRLKKVSQKTLGKIPPSVLLKKKSKIYHFQTHY